MVINILQGRLTIKSHKKCEDEGVGHCQKRCEIILEWPLKGRGLFNNSNKLSIRGGRGGGCELLWL